MTRFDVRLTDDAKLDLQDIYNFIAEHDTLARADVVLDQILAVIAGLSNFPARGSYPQEMLAFGIRDYRERLFKPYRIIYRVAGRRVDVYVIADGRRNMQALLLRRLMGT